MVELTFDSDLERNPEGVSRLVYVCRPVWHPRVLSETYLRIPVNDGRHLKESEGSRIVYADVEKFYEVWD